MITFKVVVNDQGTPVLAAVGKKARDVELQINKVGSSMLAMFGGMALHTAMGSIIGGFGSLNKEMDTFQLNLKKIEQVGGVGKGIGQISNEMKKLALTTEYTHSQISEAGVVLSRMGINTADLLNKTLVNSMNLATVAGEDLALTATGLGQIFQIFRISGEGSTVATNKISTALNATALDLKGYIEAMQYAGSAAVSTQVSFEDLTAAVAYLSQKAITGSRAGTTMKNILISMVEPGSEAAKALQESGVAANDLVGLFSTLSEKGVGIDKIVKMFGQWAAPGALGLQQGYKSFAELRRVIGEASIDAQKQADAIRNENLPAYQQMLNAVTNLGMAFGEALGVKKGDVFDKLKSMLIEIAGYVKDNEKQFKQLGSAFVKLGEALSPALLTSVRVLVDNFQLLALAFAGMWGAGQLASLSAMFGGLTLTVTDLSAAAGLVGGAINAWLGPIGWAAIGLTAIVGTVSEINRHIEKGQAENLKKAQGTKEYISQLKEFLAVQEKFEAQSKLGFDAQMELQKKGELVTFDQYLQAGKKLSKPYGLNDRLRTSAGTRGYIFEQEEQYYAPQAAAAAESNRQEAAAAAAAEGKRLQEKQKRESARQAREEQLKKSRQNLEKLIEAAGGEILDIPDSRLAFDRPRLSRIIGGRSIDWSGMSMGDAGGLAPDLPDTSEIDTTLKQYLAPSDTPQYKKLFATGEMPTKSASQLRSAAGLAALPEDKLATAATKSLEATAEMQKKEQEAKAAMPDALLSLASASADALIEIEDRKHQKIMANLEGQGKAAEDKYKRELAAVGNNTFKRTMIEQKYAKQKADLDKKMDKEKAAIAKQELVRMKIQAAISAAMAMVDLARSGASKGPWGMALYVALGAAILIPLVMALTTKNYREGSKGVIGGNGNGTSDSEWAKVSRGERLLSVSEISKLGGNERIQQLLDRSNSPSRGITVQIGSVYSSRAVVKELVTAIKEELSR